VNPLLVALDVETGTHALGLADQLRGAVGGFKIGSRLFTAEGPSIVRALVERGDRVFLDLKFHDIPSTVAGAVAAATALGVWMVNVHASGGAAMMGAARESAIQAADRHGLQRPLVVAVTVLTSLDVGALDEIGLSGARPAEQVVRLTALARSAGLDGVVASPRETAALRQICGPSFTIVTPGIRGGTAVASADDQRRTLSPLEAMRAGASYLVVGRPVTAAANPREAAERIAGELDGCGTDEPSS
jgi:orotidine-5'-phosphate decarboxylase